MSAMALPDGDRNPRPRLIASSTRLSSTRSRRSRGVDTAPRYQTPARQQGRQHHVRLSESRKVSMPFGNIGGRPVAPHPGWVADWAVEGPAVDWR